MHSIPTGLATRQEGKQSLLKMLSITKIFRFEMAHAIAGYAGKCRNIHGHSYVLHVTIAQAGNEAEHIPAPGFIIDFKELKQLVNSAVIDQLDHSLVLSNSYLATHPYHTKPENLLTWQQEPTAENLLLHIRNALLEKIRPPLVLYRLKLYETADSFAEWEA